MKKILTLAALSATLFVAPAFAQPTQPAAISHAVGYADLDLDDAEDVAKLDRRIAIAARAACGTPSATDLEGKNKLRHCRAMARESASLQRSRLIASAGAASSTTLASGR